MRRVGFQKNLMQIFQMAVYSDISLLFFPSKPQLKRCPREVDKLPTYFKQLWLVRYLRKKKGIVQEKIVIKKAKCGGIAFA